MPHLVRKRWNQLKVGDLIKLKNDVTVWRLNEKTGGANFTVETYDVSLDWEDLVRKEVDFGDYEGSWVYSVDCEEATEEFQVMDASITDEEMFMEGWTLCEQHYGIGVQGSKETDPLKALALAILRGDSQACDAARDVLKC